VRAEKNGVLICPVCDLGFVRAPVIPGKPHIVGESGPEIVEGSDG